MHYYEDGYFIVHCVNSRHISVACTTIRELIIIIIIIIIIIVPLF
jgi:hypothetical protein